MRNTVNATQINELEVPTQIQQTLTDSNMKIIVQQSNVIQDNKRINSQDNILSYKDIILPSIVSLPENSELSALTDFDQADYAIQDLLSTINQLFFHQSNPNININNREKAPGLNLSNDVTLQEFFSLKCIDNYKFTNAICNNYITTFINSFIYYDLSFPFHQNELATIVNSLNKDQKIMACDNLIIYTQKTYNTSTTLNNIIKKNCERDHIQEYEILSQLIEVNKEIHT